MYPHPICTAIFGMYPNAALLREVTNVTKCCDTEQQQQQQTGKQTENASNPSLEYLHG